MRLLLLAAVVTTAAIGVTACGSDDSTPASGNTPASSAVTATAAAFNDADVTFAQSMIPHHEQALEMAELALEPDRGAGTAVTALAAQVRAAQEPEIEQMKQWLQGWGAPAAMDHGDHEMASMDGMMSESEMAELADATGATFDRLWLTMMIEHHEGAIAMAETVLSSGSNADVRPLAGAIIAAQQAEIDEMETLLQR